MNAVAANVLRYSLQIAVIVGVAAVAARLLAIRVAHVRLAYWRVVVVLCLALPVFPRLAPPPSRTVGLPLAARVESSIAAAAGSSARGFAWLPAVLLTGASLRAVWLGLGLRRLRRLRRSGVAAMLAPDLRAAAQAVAPLVEFRCNDEVEQPSTFGFRRPVVVLPRRVLGLPADVQRAVLLHETWHVARRDWGWLVAEQLLQTAFWFHPAMWWAVDQIQLAREQVVDALVVDATGNRRAYMKAIVAFAGVLPPTAFASPFLRRRHLTRRVEAIAVRDRGTLRRSLAVATVLIAMTGVSALGASRMLPLQRSGSGRSGADDQEYTAGNGVTLPVVVKEVRPQYTPEAMAARIEGNVLMTCVVATNGEPEQIRVTRSLDSKLGLDKEAVKALEQWRFKAGTKDGRAVRVRVEIEMTFTLK